MSPKPPKSVQSDNSIDVQIVLRDGEVRSTTFRGRLFAQVKNAVDDLKITPREREIVQLLAEGKSNKEVAEVLSISVKTAETHRTNIMRKLDFRSLTQLVRFAIRNRIIEA